MFSCFTVLVFSYVNSICYYLAMIESDQGTKAGGESRVSPPPRTADEGLWSFFGEVIRFTLIALLFIVPIRMFIAQPFIVSGASMHPTFETGEYLIVDELTYHMREPVRGDVVIFRFPQDPSKYFIKRIIGRPGETLISDKNSLSVTTKEGATVRVDEPYVVEAAPSAFTITLKDTEYFVMGDNRRASLDSRVFGPVPREYIVGRALLRLLPPTKIATFPGALTEFATED